VMAFCGATGVEPTLDHEAQLLQLGYEEGGVCPYEEVFTPKGENSVAPERLSNVPDFGVPPQPEPRVQSGI
jgi:hypothetical protein